MIYFVFNTRCIPKVRAVWLYINVGVPEQCSMQPHLLTIYEATAEVVWIQYKFAISKCRLQWLQQSFLPSDEKLLNCSWSILRKGTKLRCAIQIQCCWKLSLGVILKDNTHCHSTTLTKKIRRFRFKIKIKV